MEPGSPGRVVEDEGVTIVVASRNRREELLASLERHRAPVVYVDNASTDGSAAAVRNAFPDVQVLQLSRNAGAFARTLGVRRATTSVVAFADDDSWWAPGSLAEGARMFASHPRLALINARILVGPEERLDPMCAQMAASPLRGSPGQPGAPLLGFIACGAMVRTAAFLEVGGFDPVVRFPGEEERLGLDLAEHHWQLSYLDSLVVHHHPSTLNRAPEARQRGIARSAVLTAAMRLPARHTIALSWRALRAGRTTRGGVLDASRELPAALRHRRPVGDEVLADVELLRRTSRAVRPQPTSVVASAAAHPGGGHR